MESAIERAADQAAIKEKTNKIEQVDLDEITKLRDNYQNVTYTIGQLNIEKKLIKEQLDKLEGEISNQYNAYEKLRSQEEDFAKQLETKYGRGELNLQTGEFTPVQP
tara:strand:+ start:1934 stop:2254 length:321 start_codon:yes stop_codon:yes gene_type:complete